jgi:prevent-host-death family protein
MNATSVGIRELRGDLATAVRRAEAGERIVITIGGRPAAQLGPLGPLGPLGGLGAAPLTGSMPGSLPGSMTASMTASTRSVVASSAPPALPDLVASGLLVAPRRRDRRLRDTDAVPVWSGTRVDRVLRDLRG